MKNILEAPFLQEVIKTMSNMYRLGWDERNSGNISLLLEETDVAQYLNTTRVLRQIPCNFRAESLRGKYFLITGSGKYFKNAADFPERDLGIIRIGQDSASVELLWGFCDGGTVTSELPAHLMGHMARLEADPMSRVVLHCHPTHLQALTYVHPLDEAEMSRSLWQMCSECICVFPEGVGVLPFMISGSGELGVATAEKMKEFRLVVWAMHGIYASGRDMDETFGLIETVEKAAQVYMLTSHLPRVNTITDLQLQELAEYWHKNYRKDFLKL